ncbi:hypothetical protein P4O66_000766 [Electrophorus voltai]|uniref:Family with sequence similarity 155 member A n=1 Tax=Electrophorus voltai TaxID=2609070 RepID=A0AAD8ZDJ7_9TELE|nr:hypothetical protein P4O66_000766 [Electrophorus voltai]
MTRDVWTCLQQDDGLKICFAPRDNEKPFTDSERAQRWRLSLASLLFITVLLSDHLWFCAEAKLTRTRDKRQDKLAFVDTGDSPGAGHTPPSQPSCSGNASAQSLIFIENSTKPSWRPETCHPDSLSKTCFTVADAEAACSGLADAGGARSAEWNLSDLYLSFCNSYSLLDLFHGFSSPDNSSCNLDMAKGGDTARCTRCVQAYQRFDKRAQEKYREFELMVQKYETDVYSVRTCMDECTLTALSSVLPAAKSISRAPSAVPLLEACYHGDGQHGVGRRSDTAVALGLSELRELGLLVPEDFRVGGRNAVAMAAKCSLPVVCHAEEGEVAGVHVCSERVPRSPGLPALLSCAAEHGDVQTCSAHRPSETQPTNPCTKLRRSESEPAKLRSSLARPLFLGLFQRLKKVQGILGFLAVLLFTLPTGPSPTRHAPLWF